MDKKKIIAVIVSCVVALAAVVAVSVSCDNNKHQSVKIESNTKDNKKATATKEPVKVTPTFMYFVSTSDADYNKAMSAVENLKSIYGEKVKFDVVNVDENPDAKKNFPVDGQTPALIMLNTTNDISAFVFKCADEEKLKNAIENALK